MALLAGCKLSDKPVEICKEVVRSVSVDPGTLRFNAVNKTKGELGAEDLARDWLLKWNGDIPPATLQLLEIYRQDPRELSQLLVEIDNTSQERGGPIREKTLCLFYTYGDKTELVSVTLQNRDYRHADLSGLFGRYGHPEGLDISNRVE